MQQNDCKLLVVGFDGLDFELFKAHCRVDLDIVPLHSPVPVTGPAWTSIYTGDGVSTHKVRDCFGLPTFRRYARNEVLHKALWRARQLIGKLGLREPLQECRTYADTSSRYVWDTLGAGGVSVKLVNLPVAAPVRQVNGIHVAGWPIDRRARWHWPDSIGRLIPDDYAELSDIIQWFENPVVDRGKVHRRCLRELGAQRAKDRTRDTCHRLARFFLQLPAAQFQMVQFSFIDRLGHVFGISADTEHRPRVPRRRGLCAGAAQSARGLPRGPARRGADDCRPVRPGAPLRGQRPRQGGPAGGWAQGSGPAGKRTDNGQDARHRVLLTMAQDAERQWMSEEFQPDLVIVVDDGSTDNTAEVVRSFAETARDDLDVRYVRQENMGVVFARNRGLKESRGEFIQFLDSDDLLHPGKLSAQVKAMRDEPEVEYVFSGWERVDFGRGRTEVAWPHELDPDRDNLLDLMVGKDPHHTLPLHTANGIYRRSLCRRMPPWDTEIRRMTDRLYNVRMLVLNPRYRYIPAVHLWLREHAGGRLSTSKMRHPEMFADYVAGWHRIRRLLEEAGLLGRARRRVLAGTYYHLARNAFIIGAVELGMRLLLDGQSLAPASVVWLKLLAARLMYVLLGAPVANRLLGLKMRLSGLGHRTPQTGTR